MIYSYEKPIQTRVGITLAREFGHYIMRRQELTIANYQKNGLFGNSDFECLPLQANRWDDLEKEREEEADTFASYLLMPIDDYRQQTLGMDLTGALLTHITNRYGVSLVAAIRKWIKFTDRRAAMIIARDGFACWGRASASTAKTGVIVRSGMAIPGLSVAARGKAALNNSDHVPFAHPAGVWSFRRGSEPVRELTIFGERLGISVPSHHTGVLLPPSSCS